MQKRYLYFIILILSSITGFLIFDKIGQIKRSSLFPNQNFGYNGPYLLQHPYQWLADSFVFVVNIGAINTQGEAEQYGLFVIQGRNSTKKRFSAFSVYGITSSTVNLAPFIGKPVLVTDFSGNQYDGFQIEKIELDNAVNEKIKEYKKLSPFPFEKMDKFMKGLPV